MESNTAPKGSKMIITRKNRQTGTLIELAHQDVYSIDNGDYVWITYCLEHELFVGHETKRVATSWASTPAGWCDGCAKLDS